LALIDTLDEDDRAKVEDAVINAPLSAAVVSRWLADAGIHLGVSVIHKHRAGTCATCNRIKGN
jgi:hypothetical protein